jgi:hypothetical protein
MDNTACLYQGYNVAWMRETRNAYRILQENLTESNHLED